MQYVLSVIDDGQALAAGDIYSASPTEEVSIDDFNERLQADGHWLFAGGLGMPSAATVIDNRGADPVITGGPFAETVAFVAGFWLIEAPDLDEALRLAIEGSKACNRRVEVRPLLHG